jgi:hypothetical protein
LYLYSRSRLFPAIPLWAGGIISFLFPFNSHDTRTLEFKLKSSSFSLIFFNQCCSRQRMSSSSWRSSRLGETRLDEGLERSRSSSSRWSVSFHLTIPAFNRPRLISFFFPLPISLISQVLAVFGCFVGLVVKIEPNWPRVFQGYLPSKYVFGPGALYTSVGILGATCMPHALFSRSSISLVNDMSRLKGILLMPAFTFAY